MSEMYPSIGLEMAKVSVTIFSSLYLLPYTCPELEHWFETSRAFYKKAVSEVIASWARMLNRQLLARTYKVVRMDMKFPDLIGKVT